jgi:hypothetical protein
VKTLTTTRGSDRVLIECVGLRLRAAFESYKGTIAFDEQFRLHLENNLLEQKREYPHNHEVSVIYQIIDGIPIMRIFVGGIETHTLGN